MTMSRLKIKSAAANGASLWLYLASLEGAKFGLGLAVIPSGAANLKATVQASMDDPRITQTVAWSRSSTTVTVTDVDHGLSTDDEVSIFASGDVRLDSAHRASYPVTYVDDDTYTLTCLNTVVAASGTANVAVYRPIDHDSLTGVAARASGNYDWPVMAVRLVVSDWVSGKCDLVIDSLTAV